METILNKGVRERVVTEEGIIDVTLKMTQEEAMQIHHHLHSLLTSVPNKNESPDSTHWFLFDKVSDDHRSGIPKFYFQKLFESLSKVELWGIGERFPWETQEEFKERQQSQSSPIPSTSGGGAGSNK